MYPLFRPTLRELAAVYWRDALRLVAVVLVLGLTAAACVALFVSDDGMEATP